jgi:hypothetical protein
VYRTGKNFKRKKYGTVTTHNNFLYGINLYSQLLFIRFLYVHFLYSSKFIPGKGQNL